jgi:hypothetical protein
MKFDVVEVVTMSINFNNKIVLCNGLINISCVLIENSIKIEWGIIYFVPWAFDSPFFFPSSILYPALLPYFSLGQEIKLHLYPSDSIEQKAATCVSMKTCGGRTSHKKNQVMYIDINYLLLFI